MRSMAAPRSHSKSAVALNKAAFLLQRPLGIFFGMLLKHACDTTIEGIYLRTRSDGRLFNLARLRASTKVREVLIRDMLFADDAAVVTHTQEELQSLLDCFSQACKDFGLTISLKKTNVLGQDTEAPPVITIDPNIACVRSGVRMACVRDCVSACVRECHECVRVCVRE